MSWLSKIILLRHKILGYLTHCASGLKREFSNRTLPLIIGKKLAKQGGEDIKHGSQVSAMGPQIIRQAMKEFLGITHDSQHRKGRLDDHPLIPGAFFAHLEIGRDTLG